MGILFEFRDMTDSEYRREQAAFDEHESEFGNPPGKQERLGFVATENGEFVGASSGLVQRDQNQYGRYAYLSDLLVEKGFRKRGYGRRLLELFEEKIRQLDIQYVWTWTAEYEAETFYIQQGFEVFARFENFYSSGHARVGLIKKL